jgi:phosphoglycolate phosphatase-like HAD superfamily hydrolase
MIKVATFDIDGTLMRRHPDVYTLKIEAIDLAVRETFGIAKFNYHEHLKPSMYGMTDRSIMRSLMLELGVTRDTLEQKFETLFKNIFTHFNKRPDHTTEKDYYLLPGVKEILEQLKSRGVEMGLATGNYREFANWKVDGLGIGHYFTLGG